MRSEEKPLLARAREVLTGLGATPAECLALAVLCAGALAVLGLLWVRSGPGASVLAPVGGAADPLAAAGDPSAPPGGEVRGTEPPLVLDAGEVVVHVAGRVAEPGLYRLAGGSRVGDALEAAGGPLHDAVLDGVNLARVLADGEQVHVPSAEEADAAADAAADGQSAAPDPAGAGPAGVGGPGGSAWRADGTLDLNRATLADLEQLPGVGPVTAQKILDHREAVGGFRDVAELQDVSGIGPKRYADLSPRVGV